MTGRRWGDESQRVAVPAAQLFARLAATAGFAVGGALVPLGAAGTAWFLREPWPLTGDFLWAGVVLYIGTVLSLTLLSLPPADVSRETSTVGWGQGRRSDEQIEHLCRLMHNVYERAAVGAGWETQQASRKPWAEVPEANKVAMRAAVTALCRKIDPDVSRETSPEDGAR